MSLDALKAMKDKLKKERGEVAGGTKYVTKAQLEAARLKKLRDEEEQERQAKVRQHALHASTAYPLNSNSHVFARACAYFHVVHLVHVVRMAPRDPFNTGCNGLGVWDYATPWRSMAQSDTHACRHVELL